MPKFTSGVGRVSLQQRAIVACQQVHEYDYGLKTLEVAKSQGICTRRMLVVLQYAQSQGWLTAQNGRHRRNAFYYLWVVGLAERDALIGDVTYDALLAAEAWVKSYLRGPNA